MIVYIWGNLTVDNFTPRPEKDTVGRPGQEPGLSASEMLPAGRKAQGIDLNKLTPPLKPIPDDVSRGGTPGHIAIAPVGEAGNVDSKKPEGMGILSQDWANPSVHANTARCGGENERREECMSMPSLFYEPIARDEYLERLEVADSSGELSERVWDEVHELVQDRLAQLDDAVKSRVPTVSVQVGRTAGRAFPLFSYRTFSRPIEVVDPVVVGVTFTWSGDRVSVAADASGEQSGDLIVTQSPKTVPSSRADVIQAACEVAEHFGQSYDQIAAALVDPSRDLK